MAKKRVKIPRRSGGRPKKGPSVNQQELMKQFTQIQEQMEEAQEKLNDMSFTATSGGGAVSATVRGSLELDSIKIDPDVVDEDDIEMLEDLVVAAVNEAMREAHEASEAATSSVTSGLGNLDLGGLAGGDLPQF